jgi:hypothetical protein
LFEQYMTFAPDARTAVSLESMLDQLLSWTRAMQQVRTAERRDQVAS